MPTAILDSEDEADEILLTDHSDDCGKLLNKTISPASCVKDRTGDERSGSTDHLMQQLRDAAQGLCDSQLAPIASSRMSATMLSSSSLAQLKAKRRHTTELNKSTQISSPERSVKRARSVIDEIPNAENISHATDHMHPTTLLPSDGAGKTLASPLAFTEHSDAADPSKGLPVTISQEDFVNHEPAIMFRDTGSTIPDNESTQQRWLEQAVSGRDNDDGTPIMLSTDPNIRQSSSFPWPAPSQTASPSGEKGDHESGHAQTADQVIVPEQILCSIDQLDGMEPRQVGFSGVHVEMSQSTSSRHLTKGSPEVQIPINKIYADDVVKFPDLASPASSRDHERKIVEPDSSAEADIGAPKDLYEPRPSRRRTTFMAEEAIDYSAIPEKEARKRRKITNFTNTAASENLSSNERFADSRSNITKDSRKTSRQRESSQSGLKSVNTETGHLEDGSEVIVLRSSETGPQLAQVREREASASKALSVISEQKSDDSTFKVPGKPSSSAMRSSAKRSRRHHTTIFEDHVDFTGSPRSPSLKQQQANRKSALRDVQNESLHVLQRERRSIVLDDENSEDELAREPEVIEAAPRKRGRPRRTKEPDQKKAESKDDQSEPERAGVDQASKTSDRDWRDEQMVSKVGKPTANVSTAAESDDSTAVATEPLAPPIAEVPATDQTKNAAPPKGSPTSHSPINSFSRVPYRVGLSRHQRIPSLLRIVRPPKSKAR